MCLSEKTFLISKDQDKLLSQYAVQISVIYNT